MSNEIIHQNNLNKDFKAATYSAAALTSYEQKIYSIIYTALKNINDTANLSALSPIPIAKQVFDVHDKVLNDHPEIFYTTGWISYSSSKGIANFHYSDTKTNIQSKITTVNSKISYILSNYINSSMTVLEKELAIHDYLVLNVQYDYENYKNGTIPEDSYNIYGTLIKGIAVCQGYAEAFKLLLNKLGIECIIVTSASMNHAWNMVTIGQNRYHVDVTWDDPVPDRPKVLRYKYLNVSDSTFRGTSLGSSHTWTASDYPACTSTAYEYFTEMDYVQRSGNMIYYTKLPNFELAKINVNGTNKKILTTSRSLYLLLHNNWLYYSNFSYGGYIFRMKTDGSGLQQLNSVYSKNLYFLNGRVYYTNASKNTLESIAIPNYNKLDLNGDGKVTSSDLSLLVSNYEKHSKSLNADSVQDIVGDGLIDIYDLTLLSRNIK